MMLSVDYSDGRGDGKKCTPEIDLGGKTGFGDKEVRETEALRMTFRPLSLKLGRASDIYQNEEHRREDLGEMIKGSTFTMLN